MKKIIFLSFIIFIVFLIYFFNIDKKIYYLSLGDYLAYGINNLNNVDTNYSNKIKTKYKIKNYVNYSSIDDYRVMDLINDIENNKEIIFNNRSYKLQNLLIKANLITISIGMNDLLYKNSIDNYEYADELLIDIDNLLELIRKYNKDKIYFLGFYNIIEDKDLINYLNKRLSYICNKRKVNYVDISLLDKYIINNKYPTNEGYKYIYKRIDLE